MNKCKKCKGIGIYKGERCPECKGKGIVKKDKVSNMLQFRIK